MSLGGTWWQSYSHLWYECANPDDVVDGIGKESRKYVSLAVDFSSINFVEHCHHHKHVEDHRKMDWRWRLNAWKIISDILKQCFSFSTNLLLAHFLYQTCARRRTWHRRPQWAGIEPGRGCSWPWGRKWGGRSGHRASCGESPWEKH